MGKVTGFLEIQREQPTRRKPELRVKDWFEIYETFPEEVRTKVVAQFPRVNFKQDIALAFFHGFEHKPQSTEGTCNEDICSHFIHNYKRSNFYDQVINSPFQNS